MALLEGIFIVVGFLCICISFFVARKSRTEVDKEQGDSGVSTSVWTEKDEKIIQERVEQILEERQTELVDETEDKMNRLCNEKIMAMDEFSQQILEKIDSNHQEVVFMYNMLTEKQKEIKDTVSQPIKIKTTAEKPVEEKKPAEDKQEKAAKATGKATSAKRASAKSSSEAPQMSVPKKPASGTPTPVKQKKEPVKRRETGKPKGSEEERDVKVPGNVNLQIQKMHKEGKSILEISKALGIGQGEVKLVIALYGGKTR